VLDDGLTKPQIQGTITLLKNKETMDPSHPEFEHYDNSLGLPPPEEAESFILDRKIAKTIGSEVKGVLNAHVVNTPDNVYKPTNGQETLNIDGQQVTFEVRKRKIKVGEKEHEVAETIVEPKDKSKIAETHIILGGYSVNTPHYYQNFIPFAITGVRFVFINLLGGGTEEYVDRPKRISLLGGKTSVDNDYLPMATAQISSLMNEFRDSHVILEGYSMGGLVLSKALARPDLFPDANVKRINSITLDAPAPTGMLPFGVGMHLLNMVKTSLACGFAGIVGASDRMGPEFLGRLMMPELNATSHVAEEYNPMQKRAESLIRQVSAACFKATGVFPEMVLTMSRDPLVQMAKNEDMQDRRNLLRDTPIRIIFRKGDKTVPAKEIFKMVKRWRDAGYSAGLIEGRHHSNSHMDLPGLEYMGTWLNHGQAGRLSPKPTNLVPNTYRRASRSQGLPLAHQDPQNI